jgi:FtsH-binding integral membrane protein
LFFGLIIAELAVVFILSAAIQRMPFWLSTTMFLGYSLLNGLTLSLIFVIYTRESIASTFFVTAGTFAVMSVYGFTTKRDLTSIGNLLFMALIGFLIASIVNIFLASSALYWVLTFAGVLIFVGLTAYDTQKIKNLAAQGADEAGAHRLAISGALALYLDFINLFLLLLRIFGRRD